MFLLQDRSLCLFFTLVWTQISAAGFTTSPLNVWNNPAVWPLSDLPPSSWHTHILIRHLLFAWHVLQFPLFILKVSAAWRSDRSLTLGEQVRCLAQGHFDKTPPHWAPDMISIMMLWLLYHPGSVSLSSKDLFRKYRNCWKYQTPSAETREFSFEDKLLWLPTCAPTVYLWLM